MKALALSLACLVCACVPARQLPIPPTISRSKPSPPSPPLPSTPPSSPHQEPSLPELAAPLTATTKEISGITFEGVSFDSRSFKLTVVDQSRGPGTQFPDAAAAGRSKEAFAALNAGFFTPEGAPLGLVVASGKVAGAWNQSSSLGAGVWFRKKDGSSAIVRREKLGKSAAKETQDLIQAGPMLVENRTLVFGLDDTKASARVAILWNGGHLWWIGRASPCTLSAFARAILTGNPAGWPTSHALNLDGGRSADLWISANVRGGPITRRPAWNRPVRNFLVLQRN